MRASSDVVCVRLPAGQPRTPHVRTLDMTSITIVENLSKVAA
jgi:hypothetical protein